MNELLIIGVTVAVFAATARASAWLCIGMGARASGRWARSSWFRASLGLLPVALGAGVALALIGPSALFGDCHCASHPHHLHLCLRHAPFSWALVVTGASSLAWLVPSVQALVGVLANYRRTARWVATLPISRREVIAGVTVEISSDTRMCAGTVGVLHPRVVVAATLWNSLDADAKEAVAAHESAHIARKDRWTLLLLQLTGCLLSSAARSMLLSAWRRATEIDCDLHAARQVGDPAIVADALVTCGRFQLDAPIDILAAASDDLEARVNTLIGPPPQDWAPASRAELATVLAGMGLVVAAITVVAGHPVHHTLETVLGWVS